IKTNLVVAVPAAIEIVISPHPTPINIQRARTVRQHILRNGAHERLAGDYDRLMSGFQSRSESSPSGGFGGDRIVANREIATVVFELVRAPTSALHVERLGKMACGSRHLVKGKRNVVAFRESA